MTENINLLNEVRLLCEWIAETPHQRGSINGKASQVLHKITQELADRAQRQAVPQGETVSVPRKLAERIVGLLAQECAPCADPACRITDNPEKAITECREQLWATLSASPTPPASANEPPVGVDVPGEGKCEKR